MMPSDLHLSPFGLCNLSVTQPAMHFHVSSTMPHVLGRHQDMSRCPNLQSNTLQGMVFFAFGFNLVDCGGLLGGRLDSGDTKLPAKKVGHVYRGLPSVYEYPSAVLPGARHGSASASKLGRSHDWSMCMYHSVDPSPAMSYARIDVCTTQSPSAFAFSPTAGLQPAAEAHLQRAVERCQMQRPGSQQHSPHARHGTSRRRRSTVSASVDACKGRRCWSRVGGGTQRMPCASRTGAFLVAVGSSHLLPHLPPPRRRQQAPAPPLQFFAPAWARGPKRYGRTRGLEGRTHTAVGGWAWLAAKWKVKVHIAMHCKS